MAKIVGKPVILATYDRLGFWNKVNRFFRGVFYVQSFSAVFKVYMHERAIERVSGEWPKYGRIEHILTGEPGGCRRINWITENVGEIEEFWISSADTTNSGASTIKEKVS